MQTCHSGAAVSQGAASAIDRRSTMPRFGAGGRLSPAPPGRRPGPPTDRHRSRIPTW
ncbi:hypothetical protein STRAU_0486 [Streptomyces aurantiacus JA 4570]|uniref:Uncharacterized protein n=1 Tax=Streptomyces aurantiacus JA 4570 TaxID=1286094 RepID=S3ZUQ3_9ACTN|nr:hypothetical protein STRAU_0486 [Streptomyces aurantiacus JA 4570]